MAFDVFDTECKKLVAGLRGARGYRRGRCQEEELEIKST